MKDYVKYQLKESNYILVRGMLNYLQDAVYMARTYESKMDKISELLDEVELELDKLFIEYQEIKREINKIVELNWSKDN